MSSSIQSHAAHSSIRIRGVTGPEVLRWLLQAGFRNFVFDANPLSLNFVPNHLMVELIAVMADFSATSPNASHGGKIQWALSFNESMPSSVQYYLELLQMPPDLPRPFLESQASSPAALAAVQLPGHEFGAWVESDGGAEIPGLFANCRYLLFSQEGWATKESSLGAQFLGLKSEQSRPLKIIIATAPFAPFYQNFFFRLQKSLSAQSNNFTRPLEWFWEMNITSEMELDYRKVDLSKLAKALEHLAQSIVEL